MSVVLFRVDERLIHGQVVIGWGHELRPGRYVVVDEGLAASEWEQDLYRLGAGAAEVLFTSVHDARSNLAQWRSDDSRTIVLTRDIETMQRLGDGGGLDGANVNLGGIHHGPGRREVLTYLHLTNQDLDALRALDAAGATISARDLPDAPKVPLSSLLNE